MFKGVSDALAAIGSAFSSNSEDAPPLTEHARWPNELDALREIQSGNNILHDHANVAFGTIGHAFHMCRNSRLAGVEPVFSDNGTMWIYSLTDAGRKVLELCR
jgi:hypothetical protein